MNINPAASGPASTTAIGGRIDFRSEAPAAPSPNTPPAATRIANEPDSGLSRILNPAERQAHGITDLPGNLYAAILETEKSDLVRKTLGDHVFKKFIQNKKIEWDSYRTHVSQFELEKYLPRL